MMIRFFSKLIRELYLLFHPSLWRRKMQINGVPRIYGIKSLEIGKNVSINSGCVLQCYGGLRIGNNVTISDGAKILTRSLDTKNYLENAELNKRIHIDRETIICDGVWIAANAVVLPGVRINKNIIVAAGSVVNKDLTDENCLYAGVPAKRIKSLVNDK